MSCEADQLQIHDKGQNDSDFPLETTEHNTRNLSLCIRFQRDIFLDDGKPEKLAILACCLQFLGLKAKNSNGLQCLPEVGVSKA